MTIKSFVRTALLFSSLCCVADDRGYRLSAQELYYTALHEIGHFIVTCLYTTNHVDTVWIHDVYKPIGDKYPNYLGLTEVTYELNPTPEDRWYDAVSDVAGGEAKALFTDGRPVGEDEDIGNMMTKAAQLLHDEPLTKPPWHVAYPVEPPLSPLMVRIIATYRSAEVLTEHEAQVRAATAALLRHKSLSHDQMEAVIGQRCQR